MKPYIGITGAVTKKEVLALCSDFSRYGFHMGSVHVPMLGFLLSYKTLNGEITENLRYPYFFEIPLLLKEARYPVFTMIHYNTNKMDTLSGQVSDIFDNIYDNGLCRALQLNVAWPKLEEVKRIKDKFPEMLIVLQASKKAMSGKSDSEIADKVALYGLNIDSVLIDPSGGNGLEFNLDKSLNLYRELIKTAPHAVIGFAGGFTGENARQRIISLTKSIGNNNFCIDTEGGLRDRLSVQYGDDLLNLEKASAYIEASRILR